MNGRPLALLLSLALALAGGCTAGEDPPAVDPTLAEAATQAAVEPTEGAPTPAEPTEAVPTPAEPTEATPTEAAATPAGPSPVEPTTAAEVAPDPGAVTLALEEVAVLDAPIAMATRPGDPTLYVALRAGRVVPIGPDGVGDPILDLSAQTATNGERGLLGLAWSADGARLFTSSTDPDGANVLTGFDVEDGVLRSGSAQVLLRVPQPASNHNGGDLHLGPDGTLWWSLGDGGAADDRFGNGQRPDTLLGTILRITPTADGYTIPADNPFADGQDGAPEVWAYGLRNPWRIALDPAAGDLWIADVGQNAVEEVNRVGIDEAGLNYGWPRREGDRAFDGQELDGPAVEPVHTYDHGRGCSITGGRVYRGDDLDPRMQGAYLYGDYCDGRIFALAVGPDGEVTDVDTGLQVANPVSFGEGPDGALYVLSLNGQVMKVVPG